MIGEINWITLPEWVYWILTMLYVCTIVSCIVVVLSENRNPIKSIAWIIVLIYLPFVGLIFYFFFGRSIRSLHMISRRKKRKLMHDKAKYQTTVDNIGIKGETRQIVKLAGALNGAILQANNEIDIFTTGAEKFEALKRDLQNARNSIYLQYYIFADDKTGNEIAEILCAKAAEGVKVKVIYDHVGSFSTRNRFFKRLRKAGVEAYPFFRVTFPSFANRINWRNHRKIVVIDNEIGYIGGMNIADRYVYGTKRGNVWRDTHFRLRGDAVKSFFYSFAIDWNFMHQPIDVSSSYTSERERPSNDVGVQLVTSGPTDKWGNIELLFLKCISSASKSVYIQTPYFLPTDSLMHSLQAAALAKVDVRIMMPKRSDSIMLTLASNSYIADCLRAGIKIYLYEAGMLHAKTMIIDDDLVTSGSTNFDFRSFEHNFESNIFVYDREFNRRMRDIFFDDMKHCTKLTLSEWKHRPMPQRSLESILRLMAPIL